MAEGLTCYENDERLCEDPMCLRVGCRLRNERLNRENTSMTQRDEREKLVDPYAMTVANLRRRSNAVYLACEAPVAEDISKALRWAADEIERLSEAHAEIQHLQDAKRRALAIADERAKENVALREALKTALRQWEMYADMDARPEEGSFNIADERSAEGDIFRYCTAALSNAPPASEGVRENFGSPEWDRAVKAAATSPEPTDTPDEGPDPLGYAKGERA